MIFKIIDNTYMGNKSLIGSVCYSIPYNLLDKYIEWGNKDIKVNIERSMFLEFKDYSIYINSINVIGCCAGSGYNVI